MSCGLFTQTKTKYTTVAQAFCMAHINSIAICAVVVATVCPEPVAHELPLKYI